MDYNIKLWKKNGVNGFQVIKFNLNTYFCKNGYPADEIDVEDGFFQDMEEAESMARELQLEEEFKE